MKKILLIIAILFISCNKKEVKETVKIKYDTIYQIKVLPDGKTLNDLQEYKDSLQAYKDSLHTIDYNNYINARRIEKIKYYITITEKKPTNKKYFFGWIKRTMTEN